MPDKDGYPTEEEIKTIQEWDLLKYKVQDLLEYVRDCWWDAEGGFDLDYEPELIILTLHTSGWSGNEEIIGALQSNILFWSLYWEQSNRGGHFIFKIPIKIKKGEKEDG